MVDSKQQKLIIGNVALPFENKNPNCTDTIFPNPSTSETNTTDISETENKKNLTLHGVARVAKFFRLKPLESKVIALRVPNKFHNEKHVLFYSV